MAHLCKRSIVEDGDLLFARRSLVLEGSGKCSLVVNPNEDTTFESSMIRARPNKQEADPRFLFYLFHSPLGRAQVISIATRTAVSGIRGSDLALLEIPIPPVPVQRKIAAVLSAYDDLIEVNMRRVGILEQMAQSLYREWFGKVKLNSISEGWEIKPFSELVDIDPTSQVDRRIEKPFVGMNALSTNSMLIDLKLIETRTGNSGAKFQNRDVLFPRITPSVENGKAGFVQFLRDGEVAIGSTEIIVFREKELIAELVYFLSRDPEFRGNAVNSMIGASGRQRVQQGSFNAFLVAKPPKELQQKFAAIVSPMFKLAHALALKEVNLRRTRDLLLQRLMSGELGASRLDN